MTFLKKLFKKKGGRPVELPLETTKEVTARLKVAADLRLHKQYELALTECDKVLLLHPSSHLAYQIRALTKYDMGDQDGAIQDWNHFKLVQKDIV